MGIVEMIDAQLLRRHNNTATEFFEAGQQAERERIIKLAKELEHKSMTHSELCTREHYFVEKLIAAIKGENE
jgi:hypothetical protein